LLIATYGGASGKKWAVFGGFFKRLRILWMERDRLPLSTLSRTKQFTGRGRW
jgi:hypothetical protein